MTSVPALASLLKQTSIEDHESVLQAADASLKQNKNDVETQHVRVVALLQLDRYDDALQALEQGGAKLKEKARLEHAYALYKSGKPSEAAEIARGGEARGLQHVEAQASYRTEDFARAADLYGQLAQSLDGDAEADLRINGAAVDAQLEWNGRGDLARRKKAGREDLEAFETAYNAACGSIARGELKQGEMLLKRAHDLCSSLEDMSDEEKDVELLPIRVQQVYVMARLGKADEAEVLAKQIDATAIPDASTRHIAQVNTQATTPALSNPYMVQRLVARDVESLKPDYPYSFQTAILYQDRYAVDLQSLKYGGTVDSTASAIAKQSAPNLDASCNSLSAVNAAAHAKNKTGKEALKLILPILERRPSDIGLLLTITQLYVATGNGASAIALLEKLLSRLEQSTTSSDLDVRYAPGLVGTIVSLYNLQGQRGHIQTELSKAAIHWRKKLKGESLNSGAIALLRAAGAVLLDSSNPYHRTLASDIFKDLHKLDANDHYATAGLAAAASSDSTATPQIDRQSIARLTSTLDLDALENTGIAQPAHEPAVITRKRPAETDTKPKKAKKIKASRMPKDYDPNKKIDSERWMPLRDRSYYRPKGKKGKARANLLSQGAAPAGESDGSRPGTPGGQVVQGKQQGGGNKKKKGKGGKW